MSILAPEMRTQAQGGEGLQILKEKKKKNINQTTVENVGASFSFSLFIFLHLLPNYSIHSVDTQVPALSRARGYTFISLWA